MGNLLVQAIALGELRSVAETRDVVRVVRTVVYEPDPSSTWQEARERFAAINVYGRATSEALA